MKELFIWIIALFALAFGIYQVEKHSEQSKKEQLSKDKGKETTDCVLIPSHPDCKR